MGEIRIHGTRCIFERPHLTNWQTAVYVNEQLGHFSIHSPWTVMSTRLPVGFERV